MLRAGPAARLVRLAAAAALAAGCTTAGQGTGTQGFVSGSGAVTTVATQDRVAAPDIAGPGLDGAPLSLDRYPGQIVVLNVWGSWCTQCRVESPDLVAASNELAEQDVQFVGINTRDSLANARSYVRNAGIGYPSVFDPDGELLLGFNGSLPPNAIPSTLVLDKRHRVAARILGAISATTLVDLVHEVAATS